jgi:hypothetical protein
MGIFLMEDPRLRRRTVPTEMEAAAHQHRVVVVVVAPVALREAALQK